MADRDHVEHVPMGPRQKEMSKAVDDALEALPGARVVMLVAIFDADPGDPPSRLATQFATAGRPGRDVTVAYAVDTLRAHADALDSYDKERAAGADADKKGAAS